MQLIDDLMGIWEWIIIEKKKTQAKEFHFYLTPKAFFV